MLVPFVIDADSLMPDPAWTSTQQRACCNGLLDVWQKRLLVATEQLGDMAAFSRLGQEVETS